MSDSEMSRPGISLDEWYPLVRDVVPTPRTAWRKGLDIMPLAYGPESDPDGGLTSEFDAVCAWIRHAAAEVGGFPLFLRTGLTSGKHGWRDTCYVPDSEAVEAHVSAIIEYSSMAGFLGLAADVWVVRELLPTDGSFTAFDGMPVTRERRYFVRDGEVIGHHPYWPPDALRIESDPAFDPDGATPRHYASTEAWEDLLAAINAESVDEIEDLTALTVRVGVRLPGAWSVDWLWAEPGGWHLTDMAWMEASFIWADHPSAPAAD